MAKKWAAFPHPDKASCARRRRPQEGTGRDCTGATASRCRRTPPSSTPGGTTTRRAFADAVAAGRKAGGAGMNAAVKAQMIYANYLEKSEPAKLALLEEAAGWADERRRRCAEGCQRALSLCLRARSLQPGHLDHQGAGARLRRQDQGCADDRAQARAEARRRAHRVRFLPGRDHRQGGWHRRRDDLRREKGFRAGALPEGAQAQPRIPRSPRIEYANGLIMMFGKARMAEAEKLYQEAAACTPADAMERSTSRLAKSELE